MAKPVAHIIGAPPWRRIEVTLMSAARDIRVTYDRWYETLGLNLSQAQVVGFISANGPMNQTQLASALALGRAATGSVIDILESDCLVQRVQDPADGRAWLVENTAKGAEMAVEIERVDERLRARMRDGISREERQLMANLAVRMADNAQQALADHCADLERAQKDR